MGNPNMMSPVGRGGLMPHDGRMPSGGQVPGQLGSSGQLPYPQGRYVQSSSPYGSYSQQSAMLSVLQQPGPSAQSSSRPGTSTPSMPRYAQARNNLLGCSSRRFPGNHSLCNNRRYRSNHNPCNGHLGRGKFHSKSRSKADRIAIPILRLVWRRLNHRIIVSTCYPIESSISCSASYRCSSCSCPVFLGVLVPVVCAASSYWQ